MQGSFRWFRLIDHVLRLKIIFGHGEAATRTRFAITELGAEKVLRTCLQAKAYFPVGIRAFTAVGVLLLVAVSGVGIECNTRIGLALLLVKHSNGKLWTKL